MSLRNTPAQIRSTERVNSILDAARRHYEAVGRDRFNTGEVATLAECSIGTVYRYFKDRVELLDAIYPDRDKAELKLDAIRSIKAMHVDEQGKWLAVLNILDQD